MRNWGAAAGIIVFLLLSSLAQDQHSVSMRGNDLAAHCEHIRSCEHREKCTDDDMLDFGICAGYIEGVSDAVHETLCIPTDVERGQIVNTTIKWMDENPNLLHHDADAVVLSALRAGFPCPK